MSSDICVFTRTHIFTVTLIQVRFLSMDYIHLPSIADIPILSLILPSEQAIWQSSQQNTSSISPPTAVCKMTAQPHHSREYALQRLIW